MGFQRNVGLLDRLVRTFIASLLFYLTVGVPDIANDAISSTLLLVVGALFVIVALSGVCPVYTVIQVSTYHPSSDTLDSER